MADQHRVVQIKCVEERRQVVGVVIHVVAVPGLAGSSTAATVMGDGAIALGGHEDQLVVPGVGIERPAVAEDDGLARAPVLVKDRGAVLGGDCACAHGMNPPFRINLCESSDSMVTNCQNYFPMVAQTLWSTPKFLSSHTTSRLNERHT